MPTSECHCRACGHDFVHLTFKGDAVVPVCPRCNQRDIVVKDDPERFMTGPGLGALVTQPPKGPS